MLTYSKAFYDLKQNLQPLYDEREATAIAHDLLFHLTGLDKLERLIEKDTLLTEHQHTRFLKATNDLLRGKPLQYVIGSAWFLGKEYGVNEQVLIPRPETEELVQWITDDWASNNTSLDILDIGTGSGCIPISLKSGLPNSNVTSCDISTGALEIARENAQRLDADIKLLHLDFLNAASRNKLPAYDVIVSNPPYIPVTEKEKMHPNVRDYEPGIALFVPADDALLFYRVIAEFGREHLKTNGYIYCELEASHAADTKTMFEGKGYKNVEIRKDMHGNWRMLRAGLS